MAWFKWYENAVTDAKIQCVARISGQPVAFVIAVWAMLLERASAAEIRGDIDGFDCESADAALQLPDGAACAIFKALECKGMIDGHRIVNWEKRQAVRKKANGETGSAPKSNAERQREYRERHKVAKESEADNTVTECNENVTLHNVTRNDVTQRNVTSNERCNEVTESNAPLKDKIRLKESIKNLNTPPYPPVGGKLRGKIRRNFPIREKGQKTVDRQLTAGTARGHGSMHGQSRAFADSGRLPANARTNTQANDRQGACPFTGQAQRACRNG